MDYETHREELDLSVMKFPKTSWVKPKEKKTKWQQSKKKPRKASRQVPAKRKKHRKSIMHSKDSGYCYLCALLNGDYSYKQTEEHHVVFGSGERELSEEWGLKVYLCMGHHREGPDAPHNNPEIREMLCKKARQYFEINYPDEDWEQIFKKRYLTDETTKEIDEKAETDCIR